MTDSTFRWEIDGADGQPILGVTHRPPAGLPPRGTLIVCHGFKGYMDYGFLPRLAEAAADAGLVAHRFNFSHSGMTRQIETFERPELFEQDTWGRQVHDLRRVIDMAGDDDLPIVVFGHSRGGVSVLLTAARLEEATGGSPVPRVPGVPGVAGVAGVAGVVTAAAPADACRLGDDQKAMLHRAGRLASPSGRTGQTLYVGASWLNEIEADPQAFDPLRAAAALTVPLLQLHGDADETVPVADLSRYTEAVPGGEYVVVPGATHVFNAPNPMPSPREIAPSPQTAELFERVLGFAHQRANEAT